MTSNRRRLAAQRKQKETKALPIDSADIKYVAIAKLRRPHGLDGEALVAILTDFPDRIVSGAKFLLGENHFPITINSVRHHNAGLLLRFKELPHRKSIEGKQNQLIYSRIEDLPELEKGDYYQHQLLGFEIVDLKGNHLGLLADILITGANDVYVVRSNSGKEILLPVTEEVVKEILPSQKKIIVELIPGLIDDQK